MTVDRWVDDQVDDLYAEQARIEQMRDRETEQWVRISLTERMRTITQLIRDLRNGAKK